MGKRAVLFGGIVLLGAFPVAAGAFETDTFQTSQGELKITFIGHGTLRFDFGGKIIHVDPWTRLADYSRMPKADLILITHQHFDHLDPAAVSQLRRAETAVVLTETCAARLGSGTVIRNGETKTVAGLRIEAQPAYNLLHMRSEGVPYHPKGIGNGYVIHFADLTVYVAGDTENTPEMKALAGIDIAFLPMNVPYTMTPEMVADAARAFKPKVLYPYHYGNTDPQRLVALLRDTPEVEVRIRPMR